MNETTAEKIAALWDLLPGDTKAKFLALNLTQNQGDNVLGRLKTIIKAQHQAAADSALARKAAVDAM